MTSSDIIEKLINGHSLYTYMKPDNRIPSNNPFHSESFALPNIIITNQIFWAMPRPGFSPSISEKRNVNTVFSYTNGFNGIFASFSPENSILKFMQLNRYKEHRFILKDRWELAWDSKYDTNCLNKIDIAIQHGTEFKIAMLDEDNVWNIHPGYLPRYYYDTNGLSTNGLSIVTELFEYPMVFRHPEIIQNIVNKNMAYFQKITMDNKETLFQKDPQLIPGFYQFYGNSEYANYFDLKNKITRKYKRLKIFCEKE